MADPNDGGATIESRQSKCKLLPAQVLRHHCATFSPQTIARIIPSFLLSPPELFPTQCDRKERERERGELRVYFALWEYDIIHEMSLSITFPQIERIENIVCSFAVCRCVRARFVYFS